MNKSIHKALTGILLGGCFATLHAVPDADIHIDPVYRAFAQTPLQGESATQRFTVTNSGAAVLTTATVALGGMYPGEYAIALNGCDNVDLSASGGSCDIDVKFTPTRRGTKSARIDIPFTDGRSLSAFVTNAESGDIEAQRRLPPVLVGLTAPEKMEAGLGHTLTWTLLGYHDDYMTNMVFFDCTGISDGTCGDSYGTHFAESGLVTQTASRPSDWTYGGVRGTEYDYSYTFTPSTGTFPGPGDTDIVVRFYRKNMMDAQAGKGSLSLVVPGNLSGTYYDNEGRRLLKVICTTTDCTQ